MFPAPQLSFSQCVISSNRTNDTKKLLLSARQCPGLQGRGVTSPGYGNKDLSCLLTYPCFSDLSLAATEDVGELSENS